MKKSLVMNTILVSLVAISMMACSNSKSSKKSVNPVLEGEAVVEASAQEVSDRENMEKRKLEIEGEIALLEESVAQVQLDVDAKKADLYKVLGVKGSQSISPDSNASASQDLGFKQASIQVDVDKAVAGLKEVEAYMAETKKDLKASKAEMKLVKEQIEIYDLKDSIAADEKSMVGLKEIGSAPEMSLVSKRMEKSKERLSSLTYESKLDSIH